MLKGKGCGIHSQLAAPTVDMLAILVVPWLSIGLSECSRPLTGLPQGPCAVTARLQAEGAPLTQHAVPCQKKAPCKPPSLCMLGMYKMRLAQRVHSLCSNQQTLCGVYCARYAGETVASPSCTFPCLSNVFLLLPARHTAPGGIRSSPVPCMCCISLCKWIGAPVWAKRAC